MIFTFFICVCKCISFLVILKINCTFSLLILTINLPLMPRLFKTNDIDPEEKEIRKDYFDRHTPVIICESEVRKGEKILVKVRIGSQYAHPDDFNHFINYIQLWN